MTHAIVLIIGLLSGYLVGSAGTRYQRNSDLQAMIDIEATNRRADGLHRKGDLLTEHEPAESSAGVAREVQR
jgi:hypothetical protein